MTGKRKRQQSHSMQTRSSVVSATTDDSDSLTLTHPTTDFAADNHSNVSQAMTDPEPGDSSKLTLKSRRDTQSESDVPDLTSSKSQSPPPSSIAGSSTSSISSGNTIPSGNMTNKNVVLWILANYEVRPNSNVPRSGIFEHYKYYCSSQRAKPVNAATFGKLIRVAFPHMSTRRLGNRGQSKYQYCNIQRRGIPDPFPATSGATPGISRSNATFSMSTYGSSHSQAEASTSHNNTGNSDNMKPLTLFPGQSMESTSRNSRTQQQIRSGSNSNSNDGINPMVDTRTQHDIHGYPPLQLPSPFSLIPPSLSSSSSPPLLPQHYLSNVELVSIFSPQSTAPYHQDMNTLTSSRSLAPASSSASANYLPPAQTLLADPETPELSSVQRRLSDPQGGPNLIDQFENLYNQHCQNIYTTVSAGEFEKLQPIYDHFYQEMPSYYRSFMATNPKLTDDIWRWDCNLYDSLIADILPKVNTPMSKNMANGLNRYTKNLPGYLQHLLASYPTKLRNKKFEVACVFVAKMRRHLTLNQFALKVETVLSQPIHLMEMHRDWQSLDMETILDHVLWICDCRNDDMAKILKGDISQLLNSKSNLDQWMHWVDGLLDKFVPRFPKIQDNQDDENFMKGAKQFVLKWRMYTSSVMQQLYLKNVPTIETFKALQFFFDDLIIYRVEERIASVYANNIQRPTPKGATVV